MIATLPTLADLRLLVTAAGAAPSLHNSQPWRFRPTVDPDGAGPNGAEPNGVDPDGVVEVHGVEVYADRTRAVPLTDPVGRALHISVGAALLNLRVAAAHLGRTPVVRLMPDPARPDLLAVVSLTGPPATVYADPELYAAIPHRHSARRPFAGRDVPESVLGELIGAARTEGVHLTPLEEAGVRRVLTLTAEAEARTEADVARQAETRGWLRPETPATDGIPASALGPQDHEARVPMRSFTGGPPALPTERFEALPQVCTLTTHGDGPADWLRAGQALERVWLLATARGVRLTVLHQAVEWPDTRALLRDPEQGPGFVQLVVRIGYGPPGPATPRRPVAETLDPPAAGAGR
ncbi:Acg family FMN-binding oxidoreductase [Kitasatospora sp. NBC_01539]|uniref:Acg family FMN-binding oxidoreductase n=1 Tax=Kitasatospora sp. NBC_01539 TaxID=2903577 RepID=UPI0038601463